MLTHTYNTKISVLLYSSVTGLTGKHREHSKDKHTHNNILYRYEFAGYNYIQRVTKTPAERLND